LGVTAIDSGYRKRVCGIIRQRRWIQNRIINHAKCSAVIRVPQRPNLICEFRGNPPPHSEMMPPPNSEN